MQADGERFDEVEAAAGPGFVHGQHGALAEDIGHELKALDGVVGQGQRVARHALAGAGIDVDFERFGFRAGIGLLDQGLELAEQVGFFQRRHVEEDDRPVAEEDRDAVGPRGDRHRVGGQPVRRAQRAEVEPFAHEQGAGFEIGLSRLGQRVHVLQCRGRSLPPQARERGRGRGSYPAEEYGKIKW